VLTNNGSGGFAVARTYAVAITRIRRGVDVNGTARWI